MENYKLKKYRYGPTSDDFMCLILQWGQTWQNNINPVIDRSFPRVQNYIEEETIVVIIHCKLVISGAATHLYGWMDIHDWKLFFHCF